MKNFKELKERALECNLELVKHKLVKHTFGNASAFDEESKIIAIKPGGVPYNILTADKMVLVDLENNIVEGDLKPSSDTRTHTLLYKTFPGIRGIVHTHSTYATAWAQAGKAIPCFGTTHADYIQGEIPCTDELSPDQITRDYEIETGMQIIKKLSGVSPLEIKMILVNRHAPFTWGTTPKEAVLNTVLLEEIARIAFITLAVNPLAQPLNGYLLDKHYLRRHGKNAYYGQNN